MSKAHTAEPGILQRQRQNEAVKRLWADTQWLPVLCQVGFTFQQGRRENKWLKKKRLGGLYLESEEVKGEVTLQKVNCEYEKGIDTQQMW